MMLTFFKSFVPKPVKNVYRKWFWFYRNQQYMLQFEKCKQAYFSGPITYSTDGLVTCANADFINDGRFSRAYKAAAATNPWEGFTLQWRVYTVCWFANLAKLLPGEFVECGVNTGAYAKAVIEYIDFNSLNKTFYLFDTFDGFVKEQITKEEKLAGIDKYNDVYKDVYQQVKATFKDDSVNIIKGRVPETLSQFNANEVAFLSIDMNAVIPEIAAADFFWEKVVKGGVVILDDYGFPSHINQKMAFDNFAKSKGVEILSLPTGQGIIIK